MVMGNICGLLLGALEQCLLEAKTCLRCCQSFGFPLVNNLTVSEQAVIHGNIARIDFPIPAQNEMSIPLQNFITPTIPSGGAAGSAAYLVGVFGPAFIEVVLVRLSAAKGDNGDA